ncbi:MAG TPA: Flp pilus assembly protein CpaB [Blastocatellia bacterium]|nr:Flp pilus assembly protein CpaB [Blastocatellia bacterium]
MRNKVLIFVLSGAVISGLVAAVSVSRYLANVRGAGNLYNVVVAKSEIPAGVKIVAEQLTTIRLPRSAMPEGAYDSYEKVVGRVATERIAPRELVTRFRLAPEGAAAGLSALIPEGYRAMTVKVGDEGEFAGFLAPGALVDVLAVINPPDDGSSQNPVSKIILQNIKIMAGGQKPDQPRSGRESSGAKSVTLLVTPEQAEKLVLSSVDGKLKLALRNSVDQGDEQTPGANKSTLLGRSQALSVAVVGPAAVPPGDEGRVETPRQPRNRARPVMASVAEPPTAAAPAPARPSVEIYEGVKKRAVEFP